MIDIAKYHRGTGDERAIARFFSSAIYRDIEQFLLDCGKEPDEIVQRTMPHRGAVSIAKVHPLVVVEYLRWLDYKQYASWALRKVEEHEKAAETEEA